MRPLLASLEPTYRDALTDTALAGNTIASVAAEHGISVSGMKSRVQRGRKQLRAAMEACCALEFDSRDKPVASCAETGACC